jgi:hypothetical protein
MKKIKPSKKQLDILNRLKDGKTSIGWIGGLKPHCFLSGNHSYIVTTATVLAMESMGVIKGIEDNLRKGYYDYFITDLGKTFIK